MGGSMRAQQVARCEREERFGLSPLAAVCVDRRLRPRSLDKPKGGTKTRKEIAMENRNVYTFRNGAETRMLEFGRLETGEAYVRESGGGDITQFCYDAPACETTIMFRETETTLSRTWPTCFAGMRTTCSSATFRRSSVSGMSPTLRTRRSWRRSEARRTRMTRREMGRR